jgi:V8-like Glu-specific endopeptidase
MSQINAVMDHQDISCASLSGDCPAGMARLLTLKKESGNVTSVCSGFMVSEDILVTNHHCIRSQIACENTYIAIYNGHTYEKTKCKNIVKDLTDFPNANDPRKFLDVAIIKLEDRYYGKVFKLSTKKPKPYDVITAWVIDHTGLDLEAENLLESRVTEFKCKAAPNTENEAMRFENCPVLSGNSGSPALNSEGEVVGVFWAATGTRINSSVKLDERRDQPIRAMATPSIYFKNFIK